MRILVTGSRGFLGGSLGRQASEQGHEVLGLGRASQADAAWRGAYAQADIAESDIAPIVRDFAPEIVFHGAGSASVGGSYADPSADLRAAAMTLANMLSGVKRAGLRPVILFPSSAAVYGNPAWLPVQEDAPINPISPYGFHKAACELVAREYALCFEFDIVIGRIFSVFGPGQRRLLVWEIFRQIAGGADEVVLQGTGRETRDYLGVDDLCRAFLGLAERHLKKPSPSQTTVLNLASGTGTEVGQLARDMLAIAGSSKPLRCLAADRRGDPPHWQASTRKLGDALPDFTPAPLATALRECVRQWSALPPF